MRPDKNHPRASAIKSGRGGALFEALEGRSLLGGDPFNFSNTRVVLSTPDPMRTMASADFDADGDLDLVVAAGPRLYTLRNNGNGRFAPVGVMRVDGYVTQIAFGDFDADGHNDFAALGPNATQTSILLRVFRGNSDGTFVRSATIKPSFPNAFQIHVSNFDADTRRELLVVTRQTAIIYQMNAGIPNSPRALANTSWQIADVAVGDMDFDGVSDLVLGINNEMTGQAGVSCWVVKPSSVEINGITGNLTNARVTSVAIANVFGNTRPDVFMAGRNLDGLNTAAIGVWSKTQTSTGSTLMFGATTSVYTSVPKIADGVTVTYDIDIYGLRQLNGDVNNRRDLATFWNATTVDSNTTPETVIKSSYFFNMRNNDGMGSWSSDAGALLSPNGDLRISPLVGPFQTIDQNFPDLLYIQLAAGKGGLNKVRYAENIYK